MLETVLSSGIHILHSTTVNDEGNLLKPHLPRLCQQSEALYLICITLQASLTADLEPRFFEYFDAALNKFRNELAGSETYLEDGTLTAGLLLCSIGVMHGIPWTMHLRGMHGILRLDGVDNARDAKTPFRTHLFEVMGIMDLPTFAIGRQHPHLGFWRRHCRNRDSPGGSSGRDEVEVVSGLPKSLVDIFSCIGEGGATEEDFWDWPGAQGNFLQCQLWEAYRLAGMLALRHEQLHLPLSSGERRLQPPNGREQRHRILPSTAVIVSRILSCVDAIHRASEEPEGRDTLIMNAVLYPIFITGLQTDVLNEDPALKQCVRSHLLLNSNGPVWRKQCQLELELLEEYWRYSSGTVSIHQLAQAREIELGLF
ncbi:uncharacterized protein CDV56_103212 [Aspergillus thermomutatus]|uniref:Transcription factor domain-containing protein n=1 Tax=Aspergillus thermomutatus TaxID=41047 RepID=A0A397HRF9_ASPTH|nr:uncharacterized protein CDV56_103212 [Aspergillus thermomutatus]RHZ65809.1 hypothetical protein CDV56_103212 [Aspergillus thermomutatus]